MSCSLVHARLHERSDRAAIPLVSMSGGVVVRAALASSLCVFGADGATLNNNCNPPGPHGNCLPGCGAPPIWCELDKPLLMNNCRCGLYNCNGRPRPWRPEHLSFVLEQHLLHGPTYKQPGFHSGYNEVVLDSKVWEDRLPQSIHAFFFLEGGADEAKVRKAHRAFRAAYPGTSEQRVPLLKLRPAQWEAPFQLVPNP